MIFTARDRRDKSNQENQERRKPEKQESGAAELATQGSQVGRPLLWAPLPRRAEDCPPYLLVRDGGAGWAGKMDDFEALEADFAAPFFKIGSRIAIEIQSGGGRIEIFRVRAVDLTIEEFHCHKRIEKSCDAARMQVKFPCRSPHL